MELAGASKTASSSKASSREQSIAPTESDKKDDDSADSKIDESETNTVDDSKEPSVVAETSIAAEDVEMEAANAAPLLKGVRPPFKFNIAGERQFYRYYPTI